MDDHSEHQGLPQFGEQIYDVKSTGLCVEAEEYIINMEELQAHLDTMQKILRPGCSQEVLKVALNSMASLVRILDCMTSMPKLHASL